MKVEVIVKLLLFLAVILVLIAVAVPTFVSSRCTPSQNACVNNLRVIQCAKEQWAMANGKTNGDDVVVSGVNEYIRGNTTPRCPRVGKYTYNRIGDAPTCSGYDELPLGGKRLHRHVE